MGGVPAGIKDHHPVCSHQVYTEGASTGGDQKQPHSGLVEENVQYRAGHCRLTAPHSGSVERTCRIGLWPLPAHSTSFWIGGRERAV